MFSLNYAALLHLIMTNVEMCYLLIVLLDAFIAWINYLKKFLFLNATNEGVALRMRNVHFAKIIDYY